MSSYSLWLLNLHGKRTILITKHDEDKKKKTCVATQNTVINAVIATTYPGKQDSRLLQLCVVL